MTIFIVIWTCWFASEIIVNRLMRSGKGDIKGLDKNSLRAMWIAIGFANTTGILLSEFTAFPFGNGLIAPYIGLFLIVSGMILRFVSIRSLGRFFTVDVTIKEGHEIKKDGMYKIIRHPSYSGLLISFAGFGLSLNNWISLIIITMLVTSSVIYRINIEEKQLIGHLGHDYTDYMKHTYRLIPWVY